MRLLADPLLPHSSLVYVEGDCSMNKFQTKDGIASTALNIVQSERFFLPALRNAVGRADGSF